jgi:hypothetical protein
MTIKIIEAIFSGVDWYKMFSNRHKDGDSVGELDLNQRSTGGKGWDDTRWIEYTTKVLEVSEEPEWLK